MEKLNVICYINSAGPNVIYENFEDTVVSINNNINTNYRFYIVTDSENHKRKFEEIFEKNSLDDKVINIKVSTESWAKCFNTFFYEFNTKADYLLYSHDDLSVRTYDFFNITIDAISGFEDEIGFIGFTSDSYYRLNNNPVCQSAREIFSKDRGNWPCVFELHNMTKGHYEESKLDLPKRACKVPGVYPHFNMIKFSNLEKIGLCPEWGEYTLLIDEHWSLQTLIKNLWTIWVPNVFYDHPLRYNSRQVQGLQGVNDAVFGFQNYWGIRHEGLSNEEINRFCEKFPNTNISYFNNKNTFDYQYLKN